MTLFGKKESSEDAEKLPQKIITRGDFSPGVVRGDFTVNQTILVQEKTAKQKTWRALDSAIFPLISDTKVSRMGVWDNLLETLVEMFGQVPYTEFNILVNSGVVEKNGQMLPVREVATYQPGFCPRAQRKYARLMEQIIAWKEGGATAEGRANLESSLRQTQAGLDGWTKSLDAPITPTWTPLQSICDSVGKVVALKAIKDYSIDPAQYPQHLATSKELLAFIGSYVNEEGIRLAGDIGWAQSNYSLMKLTIAFMDRKFDLNKVRVNVDDSNEWDYVNGDFDEEIRIFETKNPHRE